MKDLISRLEAATEGSRELDVDIHMAVGHGNPHAANLGDWDARDPVCPHYTTSLDAALTLVPEGWDWGYEDGEMGLLKQRADGKYDEHFGQGSTPALALCIAALKASDA